MLKRIKYAVVSTLAFSMVIWGSVNVFANEEELPKQDGDQVEITKEKQSRTYRITTDKSENAEIAKKYNYGSISIADNPELFANTYDSDNYELISSTPTEDNGYYANMYGVVKLYKVIEDDSNYDYYVQEMTSNIIGREQYINDEWKQSGIKKFRWRLDNEQTDNDDIHNSDWSPKGTINTSDGQKITVEVNPTVKGISMGSIGTDFYAWKDTLRAYAGTHYYDVEWEKGSGAVVYPDTVDLNAVVEVTMPDGEYASWEWVWYWTYSYWY